MKTIKKITGEIATKCKLLDEMIEQFLAARNALDGSLLGSVGLTRRSRCPVWKRLLMSPDYLYEILIGTRDGEELLTKRTMFLQLNDQCINRPSKRNQAPSCGKAQP